MGSDIFTESAMAITLDNFLDVKPIKRKPVRTDIANTLFKHDYIDEPARDAMIKNKSGFIETFIAEMAISEEGYERDEERNKFMVETFCKYVDIDLEELPEFYLRSFDSCRESGYDIETDVIYIMFEPYGLFETVMTDEGKKVAKILGFEFITETTWTVHSY
jgi:hypothetical protein